MFLVKKLSGPSSCLSPELQHTSLLTQYYVCRKANVISVLDLDVPPKVREHIAYVCVVFMMMFFQGCSGGGHVGESGGGGGVCEECRRPQTISRSC